MDENKSTVSAGANAIAEIRQWLESVNKESAELEKKAVAAMAMAYDLRDKLAAQTTVRE